MAQKTTLFYCSKVRSDYFGNCRV